MKLVRWSLIWITFAVFLTGLLTHWMASGDLSVWKEQLRIAGGIFFMIAIFIGGVLSTTPAKTRNAHVTHRDECSFICLVVTICLFTISLLF